MSAVSLSLRVELGQGESLPSFVSRLAKRNFRPTAQKFCRDMEIDVQSVIDGGDGAVNALSVLTETPPTALLNGAIRRKNQEYSLRGEQLSKSLLRRDRVYVCPVCLMDDVATSSLSPELAAYGRTVWLLEPYRTCILHDLALPEVPAATGRFKTHDFSVVLLPALSRLDELAASAIKRDATGLERYLAARLEGTIGTAPWLDELEFHAAAKTCEMLGLIAAHGRTPNLRQLSSDDWHLAGGAGHAIALAGEEGIRTFLSDLQRTYPYTRAATEGPQAQFGRLYQWLAFGAKHTAYDPVRDLVGRHILETTALGPGDDLFGKPVDQRRLHSIRTASLDYDLHPKRLRKMLAVAGIIPDNHAAQPDARVYFDAMAACEFLDRAKDALTQKEVESYLNTGRVPARLLEESGFIQPFLSNDVDGIGSHAFAREDLDAFMADLLRDAEPVTVWAASACDLPRAAKRANCGAMEIVRLILDRQLSWIGRRSDMSGYLSVLVDVTEVQRLVRGAPLDGFTAEMIGKELQANCRVGRALIDNKRLPKVQAVNPLNRCPVEIVPREAFEMFRQTYGTLFELARERGVHHLVLKAALRNAGVEPALHPETYHATFYRRADLEGVRLGTETPVSLRGSSSM